MEKNIFLLVGTEVKKCRFLLSKRNYEICSYDWRSTNDYAYCSPYDGWYVMHSRDQELLTREVRVAQPFIGTCRGGKNDLNYVLNFLKKRPDLCEGPSWQPIICVIWMLYWGKNTIFDLKKILIYLNKDDLLKSLYRRALCSSKAIIIIISWNWTCDFHLVNGEK